MKPYLFKTPEIIRRMYPDMQWQAKTEHKEVFLTFDDGPTPEITSYVLNLLDQFNAKATFFCIGKNIKEHPDIFQSILDRGHSAGNHTYNHLNLSKCHPHDYLREIDETERLIEQSGGRKQNYSARLFRPPYGRINKNTARQLKARNYEVVMWSLLSADFDQELNTQKSLKMLKRHTRPGSIIVFHDSVKAYKNLKIILPEYLKFLKREGWVMSYL